jgi:hypothetical protein
MGRYNTPRKQKGGTKILGEGRKGISYYPALPCANSEEQPSGNLVSKVTDREEARKEFMRTRILRQKNYDFTCHPLEACKGIGKNSRGDRWLLFSKYGGVTASQVQSSLRRELQRFIDFKDAVKRLRFQVQQMNAEGIFHNDITLQNITYDEATGKAYLIDFGDLTQKATGNDQKSMDQALLGIYLDLDDFIRDSMRAEDEQIFEEINKPNSNSETNERFTGSH